MKVLVTGATGYIGGRLVPLLLKAGHDVRVLVRNPQRLERRAWINSVECQEGDLEDAAAVSKALKGMEAAVYLVHSMFAGADYAMRDRRAAEHFLKAGQHLKHVVYLGGLCPVGAPGTEHLDSRAEVGRLFRKHLPTTEFRAGPVVGSGSASFEMLRYLVERLPVMVAPRWINNKIQPIAIRDALAYLCAALENEPAGIVEIGTDVLTFKQMMEVVANVKGFRRAIFTTPLITPNLAAGWISMVTPIPPSLANPLAEGVIHSLTADTTKARQLYPQITPISYQRAVELALGKIERGEVETRWSGALGGGPTYELRSWEGIARDVRTRYVELPPDKVYRSFSSLGGEVGWLAWDWAWDLRGMLDQLLGGPGLRRGRRDPEELLPGEAVDFWRVEIVAPPALLRLRAEMKVPGRAWLQWEAIQEGSGTRLVQSALFAPRGVMGNAYWNMLYPIHGLIFRDMVKAIERRAHMLKREPLDSEPIIES